MLRSEFLPSVVPILDLCIIIPAKINYQTGHRNPQVDITNRNILTPSFRKGDNIGGARIKCSYSLYISRNHDHEQTAVSNKLPSPVRRYPILFVIHCAFILSLHAIFWGKLILHLQVTQACHNASSVTHFSG